MALPNFLCVGAEKAGTTPLFHILRQHPGVFLPKNKETHFFSREFHRGMTRYEAVEFQHYNGEKCIGEMTPEYMRFPEVPGRVREALGPDLKLVFCLRDPVKRGWSHYLHCVRLLQEKESFAEALAREETRIERNHYMGLRRAYGLGGDYMAHIRRWLEFFPRERMFFMILEDDFIADRAGLVTRVFDFLEAGGPAKVNLEVPNTGLGVPKLWRVAPGRTVTYKTERHQRPLPEGSIVFETGNAGLDKVIAHPGPELDAHFAYLAKHMSTELAPEVASALYARYRPGIEELEEFLERDLASWKSWEKV